MNDAKTFIDLATTPGETGREDCQQVWQELVAGCLHDCTILDVGAGLSKSKERMAVNGIQVFTQDIGPDLHVDYKESVAELPGRSFDVVTAFDVIEHVPDFKEFAKNLLAIARQWVVVSTPSVAYSKNANPYHYHEFSPRELVELFGEVRFRRGWMMSPTLAVEAVIEEVPLEDFMADRLCRNFACLFNAQG